MTDVIKDYNAGMFSRRAAIAVLKRGFNVPLEEALEMLDKAEPEPAQPGVATPA